MNLTECVKPISYLKANAAKIIKESTRHPVSYVITQRGKACLVVQDVETWEKMRKSIAMLRIAAMGEKDITEGRTTSMKEAFADVRKRVRNRK
jgi:prevent-host-death family protein